MTTHSKWGKKFTCFRCSAKFYDLNKPKALCPKCGADQADRLRMEEEPVLLEEDLVDQEVEETEEAELDENLEGMEDDMPPMQETLGYDETDVEEEEP